MQVEQRLAALKPTAVAIFLSAECRMKCTYCYIEDKECMKEYQYKAIKWVESNQYILDIQEAFGCEIGEIGFWGAEPTLTLDYVDTEILLNSFPNLKLLHLSTGFLQVDYILSFIDRMIKSIKDRKFEIKIQITLDGNEEINDINRGKGTTKIIVNNIDTLLNYLNSIETHIKFDITNNTTISNNNFDYLLSGKIENQMKFMEDLDFKYKEILRKNISANFKYYNRIATGLNYTKSDGEKYSKLQDWMFLTKSDLKVGERFSIPVIMTCRMYCAAGGAGIALDFNKKIHICHRTFGYNLDNYKSKSNLVKNYIYDIKDKDKAIHIGKYISFGSMPIRMSLSTSLIKVLVKSGEISPLFADDFCAYILAKFVNTTVYCAFDNLVQTGSPYVTSSHLYKVYANGLFEKYMKHYLGDINAI
jgi:sulfatase maturation enzyme AslB (radical SAM superfamily)